MTAFVSSRITVVDCSQPLMDWLEAHLVLVNPVWQSLMKRGRQDVIARTHVPEKIRLYSRRGSSVVIPFGCLYGVWPFIRGCVSGFSLNLSLPDISIARSECPWHLYGYEEESVKAMLAAKGGVLVAPCGSGKTVCGIEIVRRIGKPFLWLCHTSDLLEQARRDFLRMYPGMDIGSITEGRVSIGRDGAVSTVQTISAMDPALYSHEFATVIVDECAHCVGSPSACRMLQRTVESIPARYKFGLTATPARSDTLIDSMYAILGLAPDGSFAPVHRVPREDLHIMTAEHIMVPVPFTSVSTDPSDPDSPMNADGTVDYGRLVSYLSACPERNALIAAKAAECAKEGRKQVILCSRLSQCDNLCSRLSLAGLRAELVTGRTPKAKREAVIASPASWDVLVSDYPLLKGDDLGDGLFGGDHADRLARHQRAVLDIAVDHRAAQRAGPEMLDLELRLAHVDLARIEQLGDFDLLGGEFLGALVLQRAHRDHRQARIDLHAGDRIAGRGAEEGLLEIAGCAMLSVRRQSACRAGRRSAHFEIAGDRLAPADAAGDEHRHIGASSGRISCASTLVATGPIWPPASMPSMTSASAPERSSFLPSASVGAKQITLAPAALIASTLPLGGMPPASTTWPTRAAQTAIRSNSCGCMVIRLTPNGLRSAPWSRRSPRRAARASSRRRRSRRSRRHC
jgi:hypothetical protein